MERRAKIVATIGPASDAPEMLERLIRAGLNVARLNFSHGDFDSHRAVIRNLRSAARAAGYRAGYAFVAEYEPRPGFDARAITDERWMIRPHRRSTIPGASARAHSAAVHPYSVCN